MTYPEFRIDVDSDIFKTEVEKRFKEIQKNKQMRGRSPATVRKNCSWGYVAERTVANIIDCKENPYAFDCKDPKTYAYDLVTTKGKKIEVKSIGKRTFDKYINVNIGKPDKKIYGVYPEITNLVKHPHLVDYIAFVNLYFEKETNSIVGRVFKILDAVAFVDELKVSRPADGFKGSTHYVPADILRDQTPNLML